MTTVRTFDIDGRRYLWSDIVEMRRERRKAHAKAEQLTLFEAKHDCRPAGDRTASDRYLEPSLFGREP